MKLELLVRLNGRQGSYFSAMNVPELQLEQFAPIDVCDEPYVRAITGSVSNDEAKIIMKTREDAAEIIAKELTKLIVDAMKSKDTTNGYPNE